MILHIHDSSSLFINYSRSCFEKANLPGVHVVIGANRARDYGDAKFLKINSKEYNCFFSEITNEFSFVLFHSLLGSCEKTLLHMIRKNIQIKKGWVIFGAEIQNSKVIPSAFLGDITKYYYYLLLPYRVLVPFYRIIKFLAKGNLRRYLHYIDFYAHFIPEEIDYVAMHTGVKKPMLWHTYAMIEDYIEPSIVEKTVSVNGNILIGNSASFTSNHSEAFEILRNLPVGTRKIIVPLSYGNKTYARFIEKRGKRIFGNQFIGLNTFLEKEEYHKILLGCSVMILNHRRQQALGNIVSAAWLGMKIYVNEGTSTYQFFKNSGLHIFSIESDLQKNDPEVLNALNNEQIMENRVILHRIFGEANVILRLRESFSKFSNIHD